MHVDIREHTLSLSDVTSHVTWSGAGAVDVFIGSVRDRSDDRPVVLLEYEAYRPMALAEMQRIGEAIEREHEGVRVAAAHRVGALRVGEIAVICAASAPHRAEAFAACQALIDRIKHDVPIWKREHGPDGAYWVGWRDARCAHTGT